MAGIAFAGPAFSGTIKNPLFSFSTLGCPRWSLSDVINYAVQYQYDAVEIRGIQGELDITKCADFSSAEKISSTRKKVEDRHLKIICLDSSARLSYADEKKRKNNMDEIRKLIDMAQLLDCPYVRAMPDTVPEGQEYGATVDLIIHGLTELAEYAKGSKVSVVLESHGDFVGIESLLHIMENSENPHVGMIWDISNMWSVKKESPALVYEKLKKYIRHTHFCDFKYIGNKYRSVLMGQGEAPVSEAVKALQNGNYCWLLLF